MKSLNIGGINLNEEQLLHRLNNNPLKVNTKLMELKLLRYAQDIWRKNEFIKVDMKDGGMNVEQDYMQDHHIIEYINLLNADKNSESYFADGKLNLNILKEAFPSEPFVDTYLSYRKNVSLMKRLQSLLKHVKDGYIHPTFAINSANSIYTSKPAIQIPHADLALYLDCDFHHFNSIEEAMNAISKAKADSEIITVIKKTVYFRTPKYFEEKERKRQEAIKVINEIDFIPLLSYHDEFELEYLGLSYFLEDE